MPSPFPGMDPWLEDPAIWPGVHSLLITYTVEHLQPLLRSCGYYASADERVWIEDSARWISPDVAVKRGPPAPAANSQTVALEADTPVRVRADEAEVRQPYFSIYENDSNLIVTSVEYLSPANKVRSPGRRLYLKKQREIRDAGINLLEIDLLRAGRHTVAAPELAIESLRPWNYLACVWRPDDSDYEVYPLSLRDRLPRIRVPLKPGDADIVLDLQAVFNRAYDVGAFDARIRYTEPPRPLLAKDDMAWATELLAKQKLIS